MFIYNKVNRKEIKIFGAEMDPNVVKEIVYSNKKNNNNNINLKKKT